MSLQRNASIIKVVPSTVIRASLYDLSAPQLKCILLKIGGSGVVTDAVVPTDVDAVIADAVIFDIMDALKGHDRIKICPADMIKTWIFNMAKYYYQIKKS